MSKKLCAKWECENPVDRTNGKYCSPSCAPYAGLGAGKRTRSEQTDSSSSGEAGAPSPPLSRSEAESFLNSESNEEIPTSESAIMKDDRDIPKPIESSRTPANASGIGEMLPMPSSLSTSEELSDIRPTALKDSSTQYQLDAQASLNLIDDSIKHLHAAMKKVAPIDPANLASLDTRRVHTASGARTVFTN